MKHDCVFLCRAPPLQAFHHPRTAKSAASSKEKAKGKGSESEPSNLDLILSAQLCHLLRACESLDQSFRIHKVYGKNTVERSSRYSL